MEAKQRVATDSSGSFVFEHKHGYHNVLVPLWFCAGSQLSRSLLVTLVTRIFFIC